MTSGTRRSPCEIVESLDAVGMGKVRPAADSRLGRDVAIRVLSAPFAGDPEGLARFRRDPQRAARPPFSRNVGFGGDATHTRDSAPFPGWTT